MKIYILILLCLSICGCATPQDPVSILLLQKRISELESRKDKPVEPKKVQIELYVTEISESSIINMTQETVTRRFKLDVIEDQNGNFIIPQDKIVRRTEIKLENK